MEKSTKQGQIEYALKEYVFKPAVQGAKTLKTIPTEIVDKILTEPKRLEIFYQAFTHDSYDYDKSYESLETLGDLFANTLVANRIMELYPEFDSKQLSNMLAHYKSNKVFGEVIVDAFEGKNNLDNLIFISSEIKIEPKIYADIFEALIYAVYKSTNDIMPGIGYACAENVYKVLTRNFKPDDKYAKGNPKSIIVEMFGKNVFESPMKREPFPSDGIITVTITYEGIKSVNDIMQYGEKYVPEIITVNKLVVTGQGPDRPIARTNAYNNLIDKLFKDYKLTPEKFQDKKRENIINTFPESQRIKDKQNRLREKIYFDKKKSKTEGMIDWKLIAQSTVNESKKLIASVTVTKSSLNFEDAKQKLMEYYLYKDKR